MPELEVISFFATHLVALSWVDRTPGEYAQANGGFGKVQVVSAFLLEVAEGARLLVTAGHVLTAIEKAIANGQRLEQWQLHDGLSSDSEFSEPFPFAFKRDHCFHWVSEEEGADFGVMHLSPNPVSLLEANGKRPITRQAWETALPDDFDGYLMLGLPAEFQEVQGTAASVQVAITPTLIPLTKVAVPPPGLLKPIPRFYGQLPNPLLNKSGEPLDDIDGMSGGPIFGYKRTAEGTRYWTIAIQSGWDRESRIIVANWLRPLATGIAQALDNFLAEN